MSIRNTAGLGLLFATTAILLLLGCIYTHRFDDTTTRSFTAVGLSRLSATTTNGAITVTAVTDTAITTTITRFAYGRSRDDAQRAIINVQVQDTIVGSELRIWSSQPAAGTRPYGASYAITSPPNLSLQLSTTNGSINVTGFNSTVTATTTNGTISLADNRGPAVISTTNSAIDISGQVGPVSASTTNGRIRCDIAGLTTAQAVLLETTNGDITLFLPADVSATIDARNTNGTIAFYDFNFTFDSLPTEHHVRAIIGSGSSPINLRTTDGNITVRRR